MSLVIGSLVIQPLAGFDITQSYAEIGRESILRALSGRAVKQVADGYSKMRVTTSGTGWIPAGLQSLDRRQTHVMKCIKPLLLPCDANRQATLPAARRTDAGFTPWGLAIMPSGNAVKCPVALAGNVATAAVVAEAVSYAVCYLPQLVVYLSPPAESGDMGSVTYRWEIEAEEE